MTAAPAEPTPVQPPEGTPPAAGTPAPPEAPETPPWGDDFDAEKAWERIQKQARDIDKFRQQGILTDAQKADLAELERLKEASKTELERAQEAANKSSEKIATITKRAVTAEVKALAATAFADPTDAAAFLDLAKYANDEGDIDTEAIKADLAEILVRKPHLAKVTTPPDPRLPAPNPAQGNTRTPALDDLIKEAQGKGDIKTVIHLQNQKLASQNGA